MQAKPHLPRSLASPVHLDPATAFDTDWKDSHHDIANLIKKGVGQTYFKIGFKTIVVLCFLACAGESLLSGASQTRKAQEGLSKRERDSNSAVSRSGDCRRLRRGGRLAFAINNIASPRPPLPLPPPHPYITHLRAMPVTCLSVVRTYARHSLTGVVDDCGVYYSASPSIRPIEARPVFFLLLQHLCLF